MMHLSSVPALILRRPIAFWVKNYYILARTSDVTLTSIENITELKYLTEVVIGPPLTILEIRLFYFFEQSALVRSNK